MADAQPNQPVLLFFTGPSGAGKSTLVPASRFPDHLSSDELQKSFNGGSAANISLRAANLALAAEQQFWQDRLARPASFSTERPLHQERTLELLSEANRAGYAVQVVFVAAGDANNHVARVRARVADGDHAVSETEVRAIHARSMENLQRLFEGAANGSIERLVVYNNENSEIARTLDIQNGRVAFENQISEWLREALDQTPFEIDRLQYAARNGLPLATMDAAAELRTAALDKPIALPLAFAYNETAEMYGEEGIREDLEDARGRLLRGIDAGRIVREIAQKHGYNSLTREYADTLVSHVETALQKEIQQISEMTRTFRPPPPLAPIRRNQYAEPDRQAAQDGIASAVEANPQSFLDAYSADPRSFEGRYVCSDLFKETFPDFRSSNEGRARYNNPLHNSAAVLAAAQLSRAIQDGSDPARDKVIFLTGVPGAGKTSAVVSAGNIEPDVRAIYEGQLAKPAAAIAKIQEAIDAGLQPTILVVHTPPEMALQNTLSRFEKEGRGASIHVMASIQAELPDGLRAIRDHFGDRVALTVLDRSEGLNRTTERDGWDQIPALEKEGNYDRLHQRLTYALEQHREAGTISDDAYRQAKGDATRATPDRTDSQDAGRAQQLPPGINQAPAIERRGALRFWQETEGDFTVKHAAGRLNVPGVDATPRNLAQQRAVSRGTGYDAGHLIGHQFGGPETPANLSLQNHLQNQGGGTYYTLESGFAEALTAGTAISVHVREMTKAADPAYLYRHVAWVETRPDGSMNREVSLFMNPESERVRAAQGAMIKSLPEAGQLIDLRPSLEARAALAPQTVEEKAQAALQALPGHRSDLPIDSRPIEVGGRAHGALIAQDDRQLAIATGPNSYALIDRAQIKQPIQLGDQVKIERGESRAYVSKLDRGLER